MYKIKLSLILIFLNLLSIHAVELYTNLDTAMDATIYMGPFTAGDTLTRSYSKTVDLKFYLSDSTDIDYLSCIDGFVFYTVHNRTRYQMNISIIHNDVWLNNYCKIRGFDSLSLLNADRSDSADYFLGVVASDVTADSNALISERSNLSSCRMFIKWDADKKRAYTTITFKITLKSDDSSFALSNTDSLSFSMEIVTLRAVDSKNRVWSVNSPKVTTLQKYTVEERSVMNSYSVLIPFIDKNTTLSRRTYCLNGKVVENGTNLKTIAISPGENKCY